MGNNNAYYNDARHSVSPDAVVMSVERAVSVNREPLKEVAVPNDVIECPLYFLSSMVLVHLPTYGYKDTRHVFTAMNVIPSTHVDSLVRESACDPHVSSSCFVLGSKLSSSQRRLSIIRYRPSQEYTGVIAGVIVRIGKYFPKKAR